MTKKKANICTFLLVVVVVTIWVASFFIKTADGIFRLQYAFNSWMAAWFMVNLFEKFRNWLMKND